MTGEPVTPQHLSPHDLGAALEDVLLAACEKRLSEIHWFRTDWQRGGAATAYAKFNHADGECRDVVIKAPIGPVEYRFLTALDGKDGHFPRLAAHGTELGHFDMAWVVMERLPGNPMAAQLHKDVFLKLADAAAAFHACAADAFPEMSPAKPWNWEELLTKARDAIHASRIPEEQRWTNAVKHVQKLLGKLLAVWNARRIDTWCHGDLHPGNLMQRSDQSAWGPSGCVLLDMAEVHPGHWVEDAVYLERLYWGRPEALDGVKPVSLIAKARRQRGLPTDDDYAGLANIRRVLIGACVPAFLHREGHPLYLKGALEVLERLIPVVSK